MSNSTPSMLEAILEHKRSEVQRRSQAEPLSILRQRIPDAPLVRDFHAALQTSPAIIAEVKRRSPSKGEFRQGLDILAQAQAYEMGGAAALSVLTDERFFGMLPAELPVLRAAVSSPILRKDFILDEYGVYESRALGADAVLLIVSVLDQSTLRDLHALAIELGMVALVEVHAEPELEIALKAGASLVGINSRDLRTFKTDVSVIARLAQLIPLGVTIVAESGLSSYDQISKLQQNGVDAFLIGEALLVASDPASKLRELRGKEAMLSGDRGERR